jgi:alkylhydroperoxidase family enzyme
MGEAAKAALEDWRSAPISERVRATLGFLRKMTLEPEQLEVGDVEALRELGISDAAIEEAIEVAFSFNIIDRLADAFDFQVSSEAELVWVVRILLKLGYKGIAF